MNRKNGKNHWNSYYEDDEDDFEEYDHDYSVNHSFNRNNNNYQRSPAQRHNNQKKNNNKPCRFYLNGHCKKGTNCNMRHDPVARQVHNNFPAQPVRPTVQTILRPSAQSLRPTANLESPGNPFIGFLGSANETSNVRHSRLLAANTVEPLTPTVETVRAQKLTPCEDFLSGHCRAGARCPFSHNEEMLRQIFPNASVFNTANREPTRSIYNLVEDDDDEPQYLNRSTLTISPSITRPSIPNVAHNHTTMARRLGAIPSPFGPASLALLGASGSFPRSTAAFSAPQASPAGRVAFGVNSNQLAFERLQGMQNNRPANFHRMMGDNIDVDNMTFEELSALCEKVGNVSKGVSAAAFARLPTRRYQQKKKQSKTIIDLEDEEDLGEEPECPICKESFVDGEMLVSLPCCHSFHQECIRAWMKDNNTCPLCLRSVNDAKF